MVSVELLRLEEAGLVRATMVDGRRQYEVDTEDPITRDLARFVHQTRGRIPDIRRILEGGPARCIAWITRGPGQRSSTSDPADLRPTRVHPRSALPECALIVITSTPKRRVTERIGPIAAGHLSIHPMSIREWMARLEKGEVLARRARRAPKLWVIGSGSELIRWEQECVAERRTLALALATAKDELTDDWDEGWDPAGASRAAL